MTPKFRSIFHAIVTAAILLTACSVIVQTPDPGSVPATEAVEAVATDTSLPSPTAKPSNTPEPLPEIQTGFGTLLVKSSESMKTFPPGCTDYCMEPISSGHVFLVVIFVSKDGGDAVSLGQELGKSDLWSQVSVETADGFRANAGGGGMFPDLFLEFSIPEGSEGLVLHWGDNPPVELTVD